MKRLYSTGVLVKLPIFVKLITYIRLAWHTIVNICTREIFIPLTSLSIIRIKYKSVPLNLIYHDHLCIGIGLTYNLILYIRMITNYPFT